MDGDLRNFKIIKYFTRYNIRNFKFDNTYGECVIVSMMRKFGDDEINRICSDCDLVFDMMLKIPEHPDIFNYVFKIL